MSQEDRSMSECIGNHVAFPLVSPPMDKMSLHIRYLIIYQAQIAIKINPFGLNELVHFLSSGATLQTYHFGPN